MLRIIFVIIPICILLVGSLAALNKAHASEITFILPDHKEHQFWYWVTDAIQSAASEQQLNINIIHIDNNRFTLDKKINEIVNQKTPPDYLVFRAFPALGQQIFDVIEAKKINFITLEQVFTAKEKSIMGEPGDKYKYWINEINYDQKQAGYALAEELHRQFNQDNSPLKQVQITGLSGTFDAVTDKREAGLLAYDKQYENLLMNQIFRMNFSQTMVNERFLRVINRYPDTQIFWCASAQMALEVNEQKQNLKQYQNQEWYIGGFDWLPEALLKVQQEKIKALVGGHFMMGVIALLEIAEHKQGIKAQRINHFELLTKKNIAPYINFINHKKWRNIKYKKYIATQAQPTPPTLNIKNLISDLSEQPKLN
ncbi:hypothetical protein [Algibacillus agarilyticus]|uniref:hypothetical protein n=1 Tax=Algibacillus agarilyticus TaxID=2234133 RepID=UPI000DD03905|nr:hypothetical protein [Algibacillus agarilyticus]